MTEVRTARQLAEEHPQYRFGLQAASFVAGLLGLQRMTEAEDRNYAKVVKGNVLAAWERDVGGHSVRIMLEYRSRQRGSIRNPDSLDFEFFVTIYGDPAISR